MRKLCCACRSNTSRSAYASRAVCRALAANPLCKAVKPGLVSHLAIGEGDQSRHATACALSRKASRSWDDAVPETDDLKKRAEKIDKI